MIQLHHVNVTTPPELEAATKRFYRDALGITEVPKPPGTRSSGAWYQIGANQLHLSVEEVASGTVSTRHVCFAMPDLAEAEQRFREANVEILPDERPMEGTQRFYVRDPAGNLLEIVQQK